MVVFDTCKGTGGLEEVAARGARPPVPFSMSRTSVDDMRSKGTSSFTRFCVGWVRPPGSQGTNYNVGVAGRSLTYRFWAQVTGLGDFFR